MKILCFLTDIFFIPEIERALSGHSVKFADKYSGECFDFLLLDMDNKISFELCKKYPEKSICFGSHSNTEQMKKFKSTGCKNIFPRSVFLKRFGEIIRKQLSFEVIQVE